MASPKPADHPLPISPDPNDSPVATVPLVLPPDTPDFNAPPPSSDPSPETEALIASLRTSLSAAQQTISNQTTKLSSLSDVETELNQLKDQYAFLSAAKEAVEAQLQEAIKKREVAEENVEMLRGQVEQARRGVMVLQKQDADRKRMSTISGHSGLSSGILGLGLNGEEEILTSASLNTDGSIGSGSGSGAGSRESKLVKRQSIMRSHRRQSSQSEPSDIHERALVTSPNSQNPATANLRPGGHGLRELRLGHTSPSSASIVPTTANLPSPNLPTAGNNNPHQSGYFDDNSEPPSSVLSKAADLPTKKEIEAIEELTKLKVDFSILQNKYDESEEARIASETCLRALREFVATNNNGDKKEDGEMSESTADLLKGIRLPPLPTDRDADEEQRNAEAEKPKVNNPAPGGWGFKLWNAKPITANQTSPGRDISSASFSPQKALSPVENRSRAGSTATVSPLPTPASEDIPTPTTTTSLTTSISSQTPLSSFVSNWTKGVSSPPVANCSTSSSPQITERPSNTRKISVTNFFSRGQKKETAPEPVKEEIEEKELPTPPEITESISIPTKSLEPSPEISTKELSSSEDKRLSKITNGTTVTELEEELGTPQSSLKGITINEDGEESRKADNTIKGKERMDEVAL